MLKYIALLFNTIGLLIYQFFFADGITITQNVPAKAKAESEFVVELTINKGANGGFAKLQQDLPEGFTAEKMETSGGTFTFSNQSVKFIWMSLPSDKEFKISYKVKVATAISGDKIIAGKFSYVVDNVKQSVEIAPSTITIEGGISPAIVTNTTTPTPDAISIPPVVTNTSTPTSTEPSSITCLRNVPNNVGNEFIVEVIVNKGNMTGFAKFLETLPVGFTATTIESQGASFSFVDQKVKYVWVSMPSKSEFKISYKVMVDPTITGNQTIDGVFLFIENDETKKFVLPTSTINIGSAGTPPPVVTNTPPPIVTNTPPPITTPEPTPVSIPEPTPEPIATASITPTTNISEKELSATTIPTSQGNVNYRVQIAALHRAVKATALAVRYNINENVNIEMAEGFTKYTVGSHSEYKNAHDAREEIKSKGVIGPFVTAYNTGKRITVQEALMISNQKWYR